MNSATHHPRSDRCHKPVCEGPPSEAADLLLQVTPGTMTCVQLSRRAQHRKATYTVVAPVYASSLYGCISPWHDRRQRCDAEVCHIGPEAGGQHLLGMRVEHVDQWLCIFTHRRCSQLVGHRYGLHLVMCSTFSRGHCQPCMGFDVTGTHWCGCGEEGCQQFLHVQAAPAHTQGSGSASRCASRKWTQGASLVIWSTCAWLLATP
jgi:hypothetical protein